MSSETFFKHIAEGDIEKVKEMLRPGSGIDINDKDIDDKDIDDDYADREYGAKPSKKVKKSIFKDDDTIMPLTYRSSHKKNSQEKRGYPS